MSFSLIEEMTNFTEQRQPTTTQDFCEADKLEGFHYIVLASVNIFLSVAATLGNVLILFALHKESSLHPPSKLLLRCLAITDLCVGLISHPMFAAQLLFKMYEVRNLCSPFNIWESLLSVIFGGVSLLTVTAVSVDRLLALKLGLRYRHTVTITRVGSILTCFCVVAIAVAFAERFWNFEIFTNVKTGVIGLCLITSFFCYAKIFIRLHRHQVQMTANSWQPNGEGTPLNIVRYRKTVSAALWIQITLVACYLPRAFTYTFRSAAFAGELYTGTLVLFNSSLNPFLYCWKIREVRQAVKDTVKRCCYSS